MSRLWRSVLIVGCLLIVLAGTAIYALRSTVRLPEEFVQVDRAPNIFPDYQNCVIPPNLAPLNFIVEEDGLKVRARIHADAGEEIIVGGGEDGRIRIPLEAWRELLTANVGGSVRIDVFVQDAGKSWRRFETFSNTIAGEPIDPYVVYRLLDGPNHFIRPEMTTVERDLGSFEERTVWTSTPGSCTNCHTFANNDPSEMIIHTRGTDGTAMVVARGDTIQKINTQTAFNSPFGFTSWHPSGRVVAFSSNMLRLLHKSTGLSRANIDYASDVGLYVLETNAVVSTTDLSSPQWRETYPAWSPDGKTLYFARGAKPWPPGTGKDLIIPPEHREIKYDLMRIGYDVDTGKWGTLETVLSGDEIGTSVSSPRVSYDGRFLIFLGAPYGAFPTYLDSDLYLLDIASGEHWPLTEANSDQTDSRHAWSLNSRWIIFTSKRLDRLFMRLFICYIDENGKASKPLLLPQEDPALYRWLLRSYNAPELITGPVRYGPEQLGRVIRPDVEAQPVDAISSATANLDEAPPESETAYDDDASTLN